MVHFGGPRRAEEGHARPEPPRSEPLPPRPLYADAAPAAPRDDIAARVFDPVFDLLSRLEDSDRLGIHAREIEAARQRAEEAFLWTRKALNSSAR